LVYDGYNYYLHSQYPSSGVATTLYYRCVHRKMCQGKISVKDGHIIVKEFHSCVLEEKKKNVVDATKRMGDQVRTIAVAEPTKPAVQIANEVMELAMDEYEGNFFDILEKNWTCIFLDIFGQH